jgi:hypothetical protein
LTPIKAAACEHPTPLSYSTGGGRILEEMSTVSTGRATTGWRPPSCAPRPSHESIMYLSIARKRCARPPPLGGPETGADLPLADLPLTLRPAWVMAVGVGGGRPQSRDGYTGWGQNWWRGRRPRTTAARQQAPLHPCLNVPWLWRAGAFQRLQPRRARCTRHTCMTGPSPFAGLMQAQHALI